MFDHRKYMNKFVSDYNGGIFTNNSQLLVERINTDGQYYKIIGIHKLTPPENVGKHHLYMDVLHKDGTRVGTRIAWTWEGKRDEEPARPVLLDKPPYEPSGNIAIGSNQTISAWVLDTPSDKVFNVHTRFPDEAGPPHNGNTLGHHSFYVVWLLVDSDDEPEPTEPPAPTDCEELAEAFDELQEDYTKLENAITEIKFILESL